MKKIDVLNALAIVKPGLANSELIEQTTSFAFIEGKVVTYNDEISISHPVPEIKIEGAIKAEELYHLLNKIKRDEIELEIVGGEVQLKSGKIKAGIVMQKEVILPLDEIEEKSKWKKVPDGFLDCIKFAMGACGRDAVNQPVLTCVHISKEGGYIEATDRFKIARIEVGGAIPYDCLIPASSVSQLLKLNITHMAKGSGWAHFKTDEKTEISCRVFEDDFPDLSDFLALEGEQIQLPKRISEILERAEVFSKRDIVLNESVNIKITNGSITIRSQSDSGWFEEKAKIKYEGDDLEFDVAPYLLKNIIEETKECIVGENALSFQGGDWVYISALHATS